MAKNFNSPKVPQINFKAFTIPVTVSQKQKAHTEHFYLTKIVMLQNPDLWLTYSKICEPDNHLFLKTWKCCLMIFVNFKKIKMDSWSSASFSFQCDRWTNFPWRLAKLLTEMYWCTLMNRGITFYNSTSFD